MRTSDGGEVVGDLSIARPAWAGAVVCHPHPAYGGDRHNVVVDRIFRTLAAAGLTVLRFDFRRDPEAGGDAAENEQRDVVAGVERVAEHLGLDLPLWLVGYSFGADVALSVGNDRVAGWVAVAPPVRFGPPPRAAAGDRRPVLVLAAEHDQFSSPNHLSEATAAWPDATVTVVPGADHFLAGTAGRVADTVLAWLRERTDRTSG
jgi:alpha/beta superfamily hydrolase